MALTFKEIQAKLLAQEANKERAKNGSGFGGDNAVYPFWNNPDNTTATIRFLPDGNENNDYFWEERLIIKLPFPGVKGKNDGKAVEVQVPCTDMWKPKSCPITAEISPWWKDKSLEDLARKYYRKKSYLFQGFVVENPNKDDIAPENPIRRFIINTSVFEKIKSIMMVEDILNSPVDYEYGLDFYLVKTRNGKFADYDNSKWTPPGKLMPKTRALSDVELAAIENYKLWNLNSFLPKKPDEDHLKAIMELFTASVNEEFYDEDRWGQFYKPNGMRSDTNTTNTTNNSVISAVKTISSATTTPVIDKSMPWEDSPILVDTTPADDKPKTPEEIIAAIRNRKK